jgi:hypothetical protein
MSVPQHVVIPPRNPIALKLLAAMTAAGHVLSKMMEA